MTYASPAWGHAARTHLYKLQVIQNKTLRTIYNAPWFIRNEQLHREANIPFLSEFMKKSAEKAFARAEIHPNPLLRAAVDYEYFCGCDDHPSHPQKAENGCYLTALTFPQDWTLVMHLHMGLQSNALKSWAERRSTHPRIHCHAFLEIKGNVGKKKVIKKSTL